MDIGDFSVLIILFVSTGLFLLMVAGNGQESFWARPMRFFVALFPLSGMVVAASMLYTSFSTAVVLQSGGLAVYQPHRHQMILWQEVSSIRRTAGRGGAIAIMLTSSEHILIPVKVDRHALKNAAESFGVSAEI
ncbi:hypothetical protein [Deinococcus sp. LM3]|uniref:hypothetical protein n=1 Tax=Deinococcus sp. LM3 TaxID=1938608 RepID=UPI0011804710|nr:hypothetical protein [Deinococcus sp. LM3]